MNHELHNLENDFNRSRDLSLLNCFLIAETTPHVDGDNIVTTFSKYQDHDQYLICCLEDNHDMRILLDVFIDTTDFIDWIVDNDLHHQEDDEFNPFSSFGHDTIKRELEFYDYCNAQNVLQYLQEGGKRKVKYTR
jgi:hypothetical protein